MARLPEARNPSFVGFSQDMFLEASLQLALLESCKSSQQRGLQVSCCCYVSAWSLLVIRLTAQLGSTMISIAELLSRLQMCILAGCDFLKALSKIGIKKAHAHIRKFKTFVRVCRAPRLQLTVLRR